MATATLLTLVLVVSVEPLLEVPLIPVGLRSTRLLVWAQPVGLGNGAFGRVVQKRYALGI